MDVLTIVLGWIGGKKKGSVPPTPTPPTPAHITVRDIRLVSSDLFDGLLYGISMSDAVLYSITVRDE